MHKLLLGIGAEYRVLQDLGRRLHLYRRNPWLLHLYFLAMTGWDFNRRRSWCFWHHFYLLALPRCCTISTSDGSFLGSQSASPATAFTPSTAHHRDIIFVFNRSLAFSSIYHIWHSHADLFVLLAGACPSLLWLLPLPQQLGAALSHSTKNLLPPPQYFAAHVLTLPLLVLSVGVCPSPS